MEFTFFKSKLEVFKKLEDRNKTFHSLSDEDKRKEIAFDCLKLILIGNVKGTRGSYWGRKLTDRFEFQDLEAEDFQKELINVTENTKICSVCARGGMMLSQIRLGNTLTFSGDSIKGVDPDERWIIKKSNIKGFSFNDFKRMEEEYERSLFGGPYRHNTSKKLANICMNVIINGNFTYLDTTNFLEEYKLLDFFKKRKDVESN